MTADCTTFDDSAALARHVADCAAAGTALRICGSGSKEFYGNPVQGDAVSPAGIHGIRDYTPDELYLTARAATPLAEILDALAAHGQMLPFDPPQFGGGGTFGGAIAAGLAGPGKPRFGGVRDSVLGVQLINGSGELLNFGGQVMKNVAGYDISRLMTGALGTLGIITEATVKVLPRPTADCTLTQTQTPEAAISTLNDIIQRSLPLAASFYQGGQLHLRLSGGSVDWAVGGIDGAVPFSGVDGGDDDSDFWRRVRDHELPFFQQPDKPLWRISVPPTTQAAAAYRDGLASGEMVFEWNGAVYWQVGGDAAAVQAQARDLGGYACLFRRPAADSSSNSSDAIPFLPPPSEHHLRLHQRLKAAFDPANILNVGRMYPATPA